MLRTTFLPPSFSSNSGSSPRSCWSRSCRIRAVDMIERRRDRHWHGFDEYSSLCLQQYICRKSLRRLIVDQCAFYLRSVSFTLKEKEQYTRECLFDIGSVLLRYRESRQRWHHALEMETYHVAPGVKQLR